MISQVPDMYPHEQLKVHSAMAVCPKCCTNLYQEREKVPSPENASTTPMFLTLYNSILAK